MSYDFHWLHTIFLWIHHIHMPANTSSVDAMDEHFATTFQYENGSIKYYERLTIHLSSFLPHSLVILASSFSSAQFWHTIHLMAKAWCRHTRIATEMNNTSLKVHFMVLYIRACPVETESYQYFLLNCKKKELDKIIIKLHVEIGSNFIQLHKCLFCLSCH